MGHWEHHRVDTSAFAAPARDRHRPIAKRDVEQPPAILLPASQPFHLARRQITRHPFSIVRCLDRRHLPGLPRNRDGDAVASPFETVCPVDNIAHLCWNVNNYAL